MFAVERQNSIITLIKNKKTVSVTELSKMFYIGEATIRRDLEKLEKKGLINRIYGGAVLVEGLSSEIPISVREMEKKNEKDAIGLLASRLINNGDIVFMDSSSTIFRMSNYINKLDQLTIITNGAKTAVTLGEIGNFSVYCTGGRLRQNSMSFVGENARSFISNIFADIMFFSCRAVSFHQGIGDINEDEAELRRAMRKNSKKAVLLCDNSKFDQVTFVKMMDFADIDIIVTNQKPSDEWISFFNDNEVILHYPK